MSSAIHPIASLIWWCQSISFRLSRIINSNHKCSYTFEFLIFPEASRIKFDIILKTFSILAVFVHKALHFRASIGGSQIRHRVMRRYIMVIIIASRIASWKCFIWCQAFAILIPITLFTLFAVALFIIVTVYSRTSIWRGNIMTLFILHPLCLIAAIFTIHQ